MASGRYVLGARLGGGGTADVYRALDTVLTRPVAIKLFRAGSGVRDEERFTQEARLLAPLNHPGLVTIYDAGVEHDGQAFLVLQLVDGLTLRQRLARGRLTPDEVAALGARLASVLAYVHNKGIVHRDVKPANVLLSAEADGLDPAAAYLADFGISRLVDNAHITATGLVVGTVAYMAPEQVQGKLVGPPTDVYALGLVLLECLTGRTEYPGGNAESAVARLTRRPEIPFSLPEPLRWAIDAMTVDEPAERLSARKCAALLGDGRPSGEVSTDYLAPGGHAGFLLPNGHAAFLAPAGAELAEAADERRVSDEPPSTDKPSATDEPPATDEPGPASDAGGEQPATTGGRSLTTTGSRRTAVGPISLGRSRKRWWLGGAGLVATIAAIVITVPLAGVSPFTGRGRVAPGGVQEKAPDGGPGRAPRSPAGSRSGRSPIGGAVVPSGGLVPPGAPPPSSAADPTWSPNPTPAATKRNGQPKKVPPGKPPKPPKPPKPSKSPKSLLDAIFP